MLFLTACDAVDAGAHAGRRRHGPAGIRIGRHAGAIFLFEGLLKFQRTISKALPLLSVGRLFGPRQGPIGTWQPPAHRSRVESRRCESSREDAMNWPTAVVIVAALFALAAIVSAFAARPKK
ncbi:hypothetical protein [Streptomyces sp. S.PB5]|uniref:hypothetical protein n=1 Tax=Streptomyces sp. S.PB5 TaxID=3020844 RepID=UPI0025AEF7E4|nr:hypothetical protein [Streptomyces sp. S.PB5]MDN3029252.1 hypothetical protein [Streptomyces sp. S.PB5]